MALRDEVREQRHKLKGKSLSEKWKYFFEYYKWAALACIVIIIGIIAFTKQVISASREKTLYGFWINAGIQLDKDSIQDNFAKRYQYDLDKHPMVFEEATYVLGEAGNVIKGDGYTTAKISILIKDKKLDYFILDEATFPSFAEGGVCGHLNKLFDSVDIAMFRDYVYYYEYEGVSYPLGIDITDSPYIKNSGAYGDSKVILCISPNAPHINATMEFIQFLLTEETETN